MKIYSPILSLAGIILFMVSCSFGNKENKSEECKDCPPPVEISIPEILTSNAEAKAYIKDSEVMFNKWSKKAYLLAKELEELEKIDTADMSFSESMKAGKAAIKLMTYMGEFMQEGVVMASRREELISKLSDEEKEAFDRVWDQLDGQMEDIKKTFESLGIDSSIDEDVLIEEPIAEEVEPEQKSDENQVN